MQTPNWYFFALIKIEFCTHQNWISWSHKDKWFGTNTNNWWNKKTRTQRTPMQQHFFHDKIRFWFCIFKNQTTTINFLVRIWWWQWQLWHFNLISNANQLATRKPKKFKERNKTNINIIKNLLVLKISNSII